MTPLVYLDDGLFVFTDPKSPRFTYDFYVTEVFPVSHWLEHMAMKSWVTDAHLELFIKLVERTENGFVRPGFHEWLERKKKIDDAKANTAKRPITPEHARLNLLVKSL